MSAQEIRMRQGRDRDVTESPGRGRTFVMTPTQRSTRTMLPSQRSMGMLRIGCMRELGRSPSSTAFATTLR